LIQLLSGLWAAVCTAGIQIILRNVSIQTIASNVIQTRIEERSPLTLSLAYVGTPWKGVTISTIALVHFYLGFGQRSVQLVFRLFSEMSRYKRLPATWVRETMDHWETSLV
jgi:hypothetical protein